MRVRMSAIQIMLVVSAAMNLAIGQQTQSLQAIIDESRDGTLVRIPDGHYVQDGTVSITNRKSLKLSFHPDAVVECTNIYVDVIEIKNCTRIEIENGTFRHQGGERVERCNGSVFSVQESRDVTIVDCEINGCGTYGVSASQCYGLSVKHCFLHSNVYAAFDFYGNSKVKLESNVLKDNPLFSKWQDANQLREVEERNTKIEN